MIKLMSKMIKAMSKEKIKEFITLFLLQLIITLPFYTIDANAITISNVRVTDVKSGSVKVNWDTDVESKGKIRYGESKELGFTEREEFFSSKHNVVVSDNVKNQIKYFFVVDSTDKNGNTITDDNTENFYTFTTLDITPPKQVTGLKVISKTSDSIFLSWDDINKLSDVQDLDYYIVHKGGVPIANSTTNEFNDTGLSPATEFRYKISAVDKSNNKGQLSGTLLVSTPEVGLKEPITSSVDVLPGLDLILPFINLSIPKFVKRRSIEVIGTTEPFTKVELFVNDMTFPKRILLKDEVGSSGKFSFSGVKLEEGITNILKIVMTDKSGNKNEQSFETVIDTVAPIIQLKNFSLLNSTTNLTISGVVNEPVVIDVFLEIFSGANESASATPSPITGLKAVDIQKNSVKLEWDKSKDKDFSHYVIYRTGSVISPIAITQPADFNLFIDALADSGRTYTYQVSALNKFGKEGPRSELLTVTTLTGGSRLGLSYPAIDIFEGIGKPLITFNTTNNFEFGIKLNKGDGLYSVKLIVKDRAENSFLIEKSIVLDTKKPEVKITSPPSGAFIFENLANEIDITGTTEPNSRVHLFIDRIPFRLSDKIGTKSKESNKEVTFDISGLPNEISGIPEAKLDAKCRSSFSSLSCPTGADFSTTADAQGNFVFKKVDLTSIIGGAISLRETPPSDLRDEQFSKDVKESKKKTILVVATDNVGLRGFAKQDIQIGTCWSGNQSWDIIPLIQYQSPVLLSTERLVEGTETIYFYFNYSYIGRGKSPRITSVTMTNACGRSEIIDNRFNISCKLLQSGAPTKSLNPPEKTISYSAVPLTRFPNMDNFLEDDWKNFFKSINNELTFPFKVRITYTHDTDEDGKLETETQTSCEQVSYVVDNSIIDPRKVLPDWLLFDFVDFLQSSIDSMDKAQKQIDQVLEYVAIGCFVSFGLNLIFQFHRRWVTFFEEKKYLLNEVTSVLGELSTSTSINDLCNEETRQELINNIKKEKGSFKLKYVTDSDLRACFPLVASAWKTEAQTYQFFRWSCDRVFGHASPAKWTETKSDTELNEKIRSGEGCAIDQSVTGQPLKAENCRKFAEKTTYKAAAEFGDAKCILLKEKDNGVESEKVYTVGELVSESERLYKIKHINSIGGLSGENKYAIKKDETNYLTAPTKTCDEICGIKSDAEKKRLKLVGEESTITEDKKGNEVVASCTKVDTCRSLNAKDSNKKFYDDKGGIHDITSAEPRGFAFNCFYNSGADDSISVVSDSPATREECCCINAKKGPPSEYYHPKDMDPIRKKPVHESKIETDGLNGEPNPPKSKEGDEEGYSDIKWSYRYWKEKFEAKGERGETHKEYNPNRYIEGRDLPACFGQDNLLAKYVFQDPERVLTVDPFKQHEAAFQCAHIAGVSNRLQFIKNLMTSMSTCLITVRTTGRGDAGACKELFTQYLCNSIWQVIRWFVDGCAPVGTGINTNKDLEIIDYVKAGFKGVYESANDLQTTVRDEYGNAKLNELLGTGEESIARKICLGAFGYDWDFNLRNVVDAAYSTPFATLVQPITRSREFITVEPTNFKPKYEYRSSWLINPGCDFDKYDIYLSCVGRNQLDQYPNSVNCGAIGAPSIGSSVSLGTSVGYSQCDCIQILDGNEKLGPLVFSGKLKQNVLDDKQVINKVIESDVRYDHLKFVLKPDRKIDANIRQNCFPEGFEDGVFYFPLLDKSPKDIFGCTLSPLSGVFTCAGGNTFVERKGLAQFLDIKINGKDPNIEPILVTVGDTIIIEPTIKLIGQGKCLKAILRNDVPSLHDITKKGVGLYNIDLGQISFKGSKLIIEKPEGMNVNVIGSESVNKEVRVFVKFYDIGETGISFSPNSEDMVDIDMSLTGGGDVHRKKITELDYYIKETKTLVIPLILQGGAKIQITSVELLRDGQQRKEEIEVDEGGKMVTKEVPVISGDIVIRPPETTERLESQERTLILGLYNLKQDSESIKKDKTDPESEFFNVDINDCSLNEPVFVGEKEQKKEIKIIVQAKARTIGEIPKPREEEEPIELPEVFREEYELFKDILINDLSDDLDKMRIRKMEIKYSPLVFQVAKENNYEDWLFVKSIIQEESGWNPKIKSSKDAFGLMQVTKIAADQVECEIGWNKIYSPSIDEIKANIDCGLKYIKYLEDYQIKKGITKKNENTAAGYNCGEKGILYDNWKKEGQCQTSENGEVIDTSEKFSERVMENYYKLKKQEKKILEELKNKLKEEEEKAKEQKTKEVKDGEGTLTDFTGENLCEKGKTCKLTNEAYTLLLKAQEIANKKNVHLEVYSGYRTSQEQKDLWNEYATQYSDEKEREKYVCNPDLYGERCPHLTGNAVDIRIKGKKDKMTPEDKNILEDIMYEAGYRRYIVEPWHFECCGTEGYKEAETKGTKTFLFYLK